MNIVMVVTLPYGVKYYYAVETEKSSSPTIVKAVLTKNNNIANAIWQTSSGNTVINNKKQTPNSALAKEKVVLNNKYSATTNSSGTAIIKLKQNTLSTFNGLTKNSDNYKYNFSVKYNGNSLYSAASSSLIANAKIVSHKIGSYWNLMTKKTGKSQTNITYKVNKNGWYKQINKKWVKITKKPSISGKWYIQNPKTKKYILTTVKKLPDKSKTTSYRKHTENLNTMVNDKLNPYVLTTLAISTTINGKTTKYNQKAYVASTTDIYFKNILSAKEHENYDAFLKKTWRCDVANPSIKIQAINLVSKIENELTPAKKTEAVFRWLKNRNIYKGYQLSRQSSVDSLKLVKKYPPGTDLLNCVDQAHLTIALYRTMGIPAIYERGECRLKSGKIVGHWWSEVYYDRSWHRSDTTGAKIVSISDQWSVGHNINGNRLDVPSKIKNEIKNSKILR
ncbi:transglutaminase-like superfamily protein [Methanobrevibacter curvatus]|uniref:Transglutaminase-like superfamily protein n=2 Tax=Methanobrevibacter curvatus TaxID=49547 RepID=A0A166CX23_9EURY|nr:transglutaminase-like superfamily protein [Methanobrevibacter curvatus]